MNYELAKKLKEAGFPQYIPTHCADRYSHDGKSLHMWQHHTGNPLEEFNDPNAIKIPTLSELIDACGDSFHCLIHTINGGIDSNMEFWSAGYNADVADWQNGSTPLEAVANLWIALHEK